MEQKNKKTQIAMHQLLKNEGNFFKKQNTPSLISPLPEKKKKKPTLHSGTLTICQTLCSLSSTGDQRSLMPL